MHLDNVCSNCGAGHGLHNFDTAQCPLGGVEAPMGKKQKWDSTVWYPRPIVLRSDEEVEQAIAAAVAAERRRVATIMPKLISVAAQMAAGDLSEYTEDWKFPKTTPVTAVRDVMVAVRLQNELSRRRAAELKKIYDAVLSGEPTAKDSSVVQLIEKIEQLNPPQGEAGAE